MKTAASVQAHTELVQVNAARGSNSGGLRVSPAPLRGPQSMELRGVCVSRKRKAQRNKRERRTAMCTSQASVVPRLQSPGRMQILAQWLG